MWINDMFQMRYKSKSYLTEFFMWKPECTSLETKLQELKLNCSHREQKLWKLHPRRINGTQMSSDTFTDMGCCVAIQYPFLATFLVKL